MSEPATIADFTDEPILQNFAYEHLPPHLKSVSQSFGALAEAIVANLPRNPERTVALRKLLEAKDAAVRAKLWNAAPGFVAFVNGKPCMFPFSGPTYAAVVAHAGMPDGSKVLFGFGDVEPGYVLSPDAGPLVAHKKVEFTVRPPAPDNTPSTKAGN